MSNHVTVAVVPDSAVEVGGEHEVGDQPPVRKAKSDPEPASDESPKPKPKERLERKAYSVDETAEITNLWSCPVLMDGLELRRACLGHHVSFRIRWAKDSLGPSGGVRDCRSLR